MPSIMPDEYDESFREVKWNQPKIARWGYYPFLYESAERMLIGSMVPGTIEPIDWPEVIITPNTIPSITLTGTSGGRTDGGTQPPGNPLQKTGGKELEKLLNSGTNIVDPCWLMNTFEGMKGWMEGGKLTFYTGEIPLTRGPVAKVRTRAGWGWHGDGASPDYFQGYTMESINENGDVMCQVMGWTGPPHCRPPGAYFPLDAQNCTGESIGGDASMATLNPAETMWQRFEDICLRTQYPECGPTESPPLVEPPA